MIYHKTIAALLLLILNLIIAKPVLSSERDCSALLSHLRERSIDDIWVFSEEREAQFARLWDGIDSDSSSQMVFDRMSALATLLLVARMEQLPQSSQKRMSAVMKDLLEPTSSDAKTWRSKYARWRGPHYNPLSNKVWIAEKEDSMMLSVIRIHEYTHALVRNGNPRSLLTYLATGLIEVLILLPLPLSVQPRIKQEYPAFGAEWELLQRIPQRVKDEQLRTITQTTRMSDVTRKALFIFSENYDSTERQIIQAALSDNDLESFDVQAGVQVLEGLVPKSDVVSIGLWKKSALVRSSFILQFRELHRKISASVNSDETERRALLKILEASIADKDRYIQLRLKDSGYTPVNIWLNTTFNPAMILLRGFYALSFFRQLGQGDKFNQGFPGIDAYLFLEYLRWMQ